MTLGLVVTNYNNLDPSSLLLIMVTWYDRVKLYMKRHTTVYFSCQAVLLWTGLKSPSHWYESYPSLTSPSDFAVKKSVKCKLRFLTRLHDYGRWKSQQGPENWALNTQLESVQTFPFPQTCATIVRTCYSCYWSTSMQPSCHIQVNPALSGYKKQGIAKRSTVQWRISSECPRSHLWQIDIGLNYI